MKRKYEVYLFDKDVVLERQSTLQCDKIILNVCNLYVTYQLRRMHLLQLLEFKCRDILKWLLIWEKISEPQMLLKIICKEVLLKRKIKVRSIKVSIKSTFLKKILLNTINLKYISIYN